MFCTMKTGISRNMLAHVLDDEPRPEIVEVSRRRANNDADGFSLIERRLSVNVRSPKRAERINNNALFMLRLPQLNFGSKRAKIAL